MLQFATTWMELQGIMLSEISRKEKKKYYRVSLIPETNKTQTHRKIRLWRVGEVGNAGRRPKSRYLACNVQCDEQSQHCCMINSKVVKRVNSSSHYKEFFFLFFSFLFFFYFHCIYMRRCKLVEPVVVSISSYMYIKPLGYTP